MAGIALQAHLKTTKYQNIIQYYHYFLNKRYLNTKKKEASNARKEVF